MIALTPALGELQMFIRLPTATETVIGVNWLECNGVAVSRANYSALYNHLNTMRVARGTGSTTLKVAMTTVDTTAQINNFNDTWPGGRQSAVSSAYSFSPFLIQVDSEKMLVTSKGAWDYEILTVERAREGTLAASHNLNATVSLATDMPFGSGDGVTTFNLPDLHGRVPWSAARTGGHIDMQVGKDDRAPLAGRRPKHRHDYEVRTGSAHGNQAPFTSNTDTGATARGGDTYGGWGWGGYGLYVGPRDENGGAAFGTTPFDAPGYVVTGVWGIRFVA